MVDPFFQNTNNQQNNNQNPQNQWWNQPQNFQSQNNTNSASAQNTSNPQQTPQQNPQEVLKNQIQELNSQQTQIQQKYQELKDLYQNNELNIEQKQQVHDQMKKLSDLYTQNKQTLAMIATNISWEKQVQINKNVEVKQTKGRKKLSFGWIMIWCGIIFLFLVWWLAVVFYYLIQNPDQLVGVGIDPATATQLLQVFSILFFGLLFFASLGMLIVNFYRLTKSKNKKKIWYIFWVFFGFVLLIGTLVVWARTLNTLRDIQVGSIVDPNLLVSPSIVVKWDSILLWSDPNLVTIAPANITYELNTRLFNKQVVPWFGSVQNMVITLNCGNWEKLNLDTKDWAAFIWACFYQKKGKYPVSLDVEYINADTSEKLSENVTVWDMEIRSEITLATNKWNYSKWKNELVVWKNPIKITYDASDIFKEFQLSTYEVIRDANWDWTADKSDYSIYTHLYTWAWVYNVFVRFPDINEHIYTFPIRVEQSDVPVWYVDYTQISKEEYNVVAKFYGDWPDISEYVFNILDKKSGKKIDTVTSKSSSINYTFPWNWTYAVQLLFVTQQWKQWSAESENIEVGWSQFQIFYDLSIKTPTKPDFEKIENSNNIEITEIPTILKIDITNIIPSLATAQKKVFVDWTAVVSTNDSFQVTLDENRDYNIKIEVSDPNRDISSNKEFKLSVKRDDIIWKLLVSPDSVWIAPFTVKFDASTTMINDPEDQIVYFSRNFGDWDQKPNISQSIISHTYNYDFENENGIFYPKVTIKTKKWREIVIWSGTIISVKKPIVKLDISLDSHPAQFARIWEKVDMSLNIDWLPSKIVRDFANWNTLECKGRECTETSQIYNEAWEYDISVVVSYEDKPDVDWSIKLLVE